MRDVTDGISNSMLVGERTHFRNFVANQPRIDADSTWYAAIPNATRPAGMMGPMAGMMEASPSLILGHVGMTTPMMTMHHPSNTTNHIANFSSLHEGGFHFLMADGSAHFLSENIADETFRWLGQMSDGEVLCEF